MGPIRKLGVAVVMAAVMAGGLGTATLEAKKKGGGDPQAAICEYLSSVLAYPYLNEYIRVVVQELYTSYGCGA